MYKRGVGSVCMAVATAVALLNRSMPVPFVAHECGCGVSWSQEESISAV